ncbi:MAG: cytochrome c biogenesis protein CcsA [Fimbriimonadaceae bacterium]|nr:cytochrome c biogenesis protein CcsA [Fimbriimonadaceae bacterium]
MNPSTLPVNSLNWLGTAGSIFILLATIFALASFVTAILNRPKLPQLFVQLSSLNFIAAFVSLIVLFVNSQFQIKYVYKHSALDHELQYKIAGAWSGQEGSFLLWAVTSGIFLSLCIRAAKGYQRQFAAVGSVFLTALGGILMFESPFFFNPNGVDISNGLGMPPSLLNYWVVIHPPTIFLGFGLLTSLFAWSVAALLSRDLETWIDQIRPWSLIGLSLLGVGLCMGGFWAYETLGWGGFWMWDPVENTSFVPWVALVAFVHGIFVQKAKKKWQLTNAILAAVPFLAFGYGTFLTRSGFLGDTSVHSFAQMNRSALYILIGLVSAALIGFIVVYRKTAKWYRAENPEQTTEKAGWNKETFYSYGNWLLLSLGVITGFGMSVPLVQSLMQQKPKVVEEHLYNTIISFPFLPLIFLMAIAPFLTWRNKPAVEVLKGFTNVLAASIATVGFILLWLKWGGQSVQFGPAVLTFAGQAGDQTKQTSMLFGAFPMPTIPWVLFLTWLCSFTVFANLWKGAKLFNSNKASAGGMLTHIGAILAVTGLIFSRGLEQKVEGIVHESKSLEAFGYQVDLHGNTSDFVDRNNKIKLTYNKDGRSFEATPGLYFIAGADGEPQGFIWPDIHSWPLYDVYTVVQPFVIDTSNETVEFGGSEPVQVLPGQSAQFYDVLLDYHGYEVEGTVGTFGAKFITTVEVNNKGVKSTVHPYIKLLGPGEMERPVVDLGRGLGLYVDKIDAATKAVSLVIKYTTPAYPVQIFYKPLTILVWWGVGIMTLGGFISAFYRRNRKTPLAPVGEPEVPATDQTESNATSDTLEV